MFPVFTLKSCFEFLLSFSCASLASRCLPWLFSPVLSCPSVKIIHFWLDTCQWNFRVCAFVRCNSMHVRFWQMPCHESSPCFSLFIYLFIFVIHTCHLSLVKLIFLGNNEFLKTSKITNEGWRRNDEVDLLYSWLKNTLNLGKQTNSNKTIWNAGFDVSELNASLLYCFFCLYPWPMKSYFNKQPLNTSQMMEKLEFNAEQHFLVNHTKQ